MCVLCCVGAGIGVQCVVRCVRGVYVWCVACVLGCVLCLWKAVGGVCGAAWHAEKPSVCRFKTSPCAGSKRIHVYQQNARMLNTCARFAGTHGGVSNQHMEGRGEGGGGWVRRGGGRGSLLFLFSLPALVVSPLSETMTMITRPVGLSLSVHTQLTCPTRVQGPIPCRSDMFASCNCLGVSSANLVPLEMKWGLLEMGVFGGVSM